MDLTFPFTILNELWDIEKRPVMSLSRVCCNCLSYTCKSCLFHTIIYLHSKYIFKFLLYVYDDETHKKELCTDNVSGTRICLKC